MVDELAESGLYSSERIGYGGAPSPSYAIFKRLRAAATDVEMIALLQHTSAVVRSYAAQHVIEKNLDADALDPLLTDRELVATQFGCIGGSMSVAQVTVQSLCNWHDAPLAAKKLRSIAKGNGDNAELAQRCLSMR